MFFQRPAAVPGVIFDSDMGVNIDAVLALAVLYGAPSKIRVISVTTTNPDLTSAAYCDVIARFYATGAKLNTTPVHYHFPIGYTEPGSRDRQVSGAGMLKKALETKTEEGTPAFGVNVQEVADTGDVPVVIRNALTGQKDGEAMIVAAGPASNLVRALALPGNRDLLAAKLRTLVLAAGDFSGSTADPRIRADVSAARRLFADWPGSIVVIPREAGAALPYPGASIAADFTWAPAHPVVEAYKAWKPMPYDAPSQAVLAALYAVDPKSDLLTLSDPGRINVSDDGRTTFTPSASGKHRYLIVKPDAEWKSSVVKAFTTLASAKPAVPAGRGPRPQQQQQQQQVPKIPQP